MNLSTSFWVGKRVCVTGATGFCGSWLSRWLTLLGAQVFGFALPPSTSPNLYSGIDKDGINTEYGDIRNKHSIAQFLEETQPEIIFHLAAQALVSQAQIYPISTFETNVLGTVNLLEAVRNVDSVKVVIIVTSDKCYDSTLITNGQVYRETDKLGGTEPYSSSKACAEFVTEAYRQAYFKNKLVIATVRAGNIIGGGDWSITRLIPDCVRAIVAHKTIELRHPDFIRPWQHVLDPLNGYLILAEKLWSNNEYSGAWNFGPRFDKEFPWTVEKVVDTLLDLWPAERDWVQIPAEFVEDRILLVNTDKVAEKLEFTNKLNTFESISWTAKWFKQYYRGINPDKLVVDQIRNYMELM